LSSWEASGIKQVQNDINNILQEEREDVRRNPETKELEEK
jgi:hypothetical protein